MNENTKKIEEKNPTAENIMGTLPVGKLLMTMSVPMILSMMVSSLYSIIDSIFISRLGENALTAMSLATPVATLLACISVGFTVGMNAVLSKKLGEGDAKAANKAAGNGLLINWIVAAVFMIFGLFFTRPFYAMQTGVAEIQELGIAYTSITCIFAFGLANQTMLERMLMATGKPLGAVLALFTGTIVNLILDPILIFGYFGMPELGMRGAAIATVIAQFTAAGVALTFNLVVNKEIKFGFEMFKPERKTMAQIWSVGFPAALQQSISPLMIFGMNQVLLGFTTAAPAVYVIYVRLQSIVLIPIWGLRNTVVSIISYNYGAGYRERIQKIIKICLIATVAITCVGVVAFQAIPNLLLALFNAEGEVLSIGIVALRIISFVFPFSGITLIMGAFFQALDGSVKTLVTSIVQCVLMLCSSFILARIGDVYTVWYAFIITEVAVALIAILFMKDTSRNVIQAIPNKI